MKTEINSENHPADSLVTFLFSKLKKLLMLLGLVAVFSFTMVNLSPIDPVNAYIGADMLQISQAQKELIAERWGLNQPAMTRFVNWAGQLLRGNFGHSMIFDEPVLEVIGKRFLTSLWLMLFAWVLSGVIGFILGVAAGLFEGSLLDRVIRLYSYTLSSTPTFWIAIVLLIIFSVTLQWTPICGAYPVAVLPKDVTLWQRLHHLLLPALTLSVIGVANIALHTREKVIDALHSDYILFARAQGEAKPGIAWFHLLRNIVLPAVTLQFASLGELFGGSALAEQVFAYPGLGQATVSAGIRGDVPLLLGIVIFSTLFVYIGNTVADLLYVVIDPRIQYNKHD